MGAFLAAVPAAISAGSALYNMFQGSPGQNVKAPAMWQAPRMNEAATSALDAIPQQSQYNTYGQTLPLAGATTAGLYNNPYAQFMQGGAAGAAGLGMTGALNAFEQGSSLYPYAQAVMQTGFDPQQALYERTAQQVAQQARAGQAARGVLTTPYGAGLENKAMSDFNIDWQNSQLQRQIAAGGAGQNLINAGANITAAAPGNFMQGATYPYATFNTIGQGQLGALNQYGQFGQSAAQIPQQQIANYLQYIGAGNQANQVANQNYQTQLNQANLGFNQQQTMGSQFGQGIFGLQQAFNKYPGVSGGMAPYTPYGPGF